MATQIDYARIVLLNRTIRELTSANPVLLSGEAAVADVGTVRPDLRFGDGIRPWTALPSFRAGGIGGGIFAPFAVQTTINGHSLFQVNDIPGLARGDAISTFGPGEAAGDVGLTTVQMNGAVNGYVLQVAGATHTRPNIYLATFEAACDAGPGMSNGVWIAAGKTAQDIVFNLENCASVFNPSNRANFLQVRGDGSGQLGSFGPNGNNGLVWDAAGHFNVTGTATLPGRTLGELNDVTISGLRTGDVLQWNGTAWGNVGQLEGYVSRIDTGVGLAGGPITTAGTIRLEDTMVRAGHYTNADITVDQQGRITWAGTGNNALAGLNDVAVTDPQADEVLTYNGTAWGNRALPNAGFLGDLLITDPQEGQALTWDGTNWVNSTPANALETLTDVDIVDKAQGEVLSWNEQTGKWTNSVLPGGSVIALETLQDVDINNPEPGQVLTWDGSNWVNEKGGGASVTVDTTPPADPESGWLWWDSVSGQLFVWYDDGTSAQWVIANSDEGFGGGGSGPPGGGGNGATALAGLTDVSIPRDAGRGLEGGSLLTFDTLTQKWRDNGNAYIHGSLEIWKGPPYLRTFFVDADGSGVLGPSPNQLVWDASGHFTLTGTATLPGSTTLAGLSDVTLTAPTPNQLLTFDGTSWRNGGPVNVNAAFNVLTGVPAYFYGPVQLNGPTVTLLSGTISGLSVPIAYSLADAVAPKSMDVMITMPLTIPANLTSSRAQCSTATTAARSWGIWRYNNATSGAQIGTLTFASGTYIGTFSGVGASLVAGDVLRLVPVADTAQANISVTIHAVRA